MRWFTFCSFSLLVLAMSCTEVVTDPPPTDEELLQLQLNLPANPYDYASLDLPYYLQDLNTRREDNTPESNPITDWGATLGRVLFYDKELSANRTISCASCHHQENSFADPVRFSEGFAGGQTLRNSMSLTNARFYRAGHFFWDERAASLEDQVLQPIVDHIEMGLSLTEMVERLGRQPHYEVLFERAYGDGPITEEGVELALAQFVRSLVSYHSPFDEAILSAPEQIDPFLIGESELPGLSEAENRGMIVFFNQGRCDGCHKTAFMVTDVPTNNGLDSVIMDLGIGGITGNAIDMGRFKIPSLRNVAVTAPYMHDGRFATLEEVVEHYNSQVKYTPSLDLRLTGIGSNMNVPRRLNLTEQQKADLVTFLHALTDENFLTDERFSDPFR